MNRRDVLKFCGPAAVAIVAGPIVLGNSFTAFPRERHGVIQQIIAESGAMWLGVRDRENGHHPIVIYFGDGDAYELRYYGQWEIQPRSLTATEQGEFAEYIKDVSPHMGTEIGSRIHPKIDHYIRAWVKNGRRPDWIVSVTGY